MNVNLYYAQDNTDIITFSMLNTINSLNIFVFQTRPPAAAASPLNSNNGVVAAAIKTRLVSGYEKGLRNISMKMTCLSAEMSLTTSDRNAYIMSCVRAPCVLLKLMTSKKFNRPVAPVLMNCDNEMQVWHVFGVGKGKEPASMARIRGVTAWIDGGVETFIHKELISFSGNIPSAFISALSKNAPNIDDVDTMKLIYPNLEINGDDVIVECGRQG
ncbi:ac146-like protein [Alphabaculovirus altersperidaniae]|uniref:Ac146-like protein n=1 Tax=Spodoptera eridania nucleopolyhedrovirus TaxID=2315721 RepID=A0ABX6TRV2_9ABAC|nr:ac146-like protein [Spodoptera eridania nucleopolyhedrovirus]QNV47849.1 ac146-like protein [Spodoptera eridania nucleopolyhedrovirus]